MDDQALVARSKALANRVRELSTLDAMLSLPGARSHGYVWHPRLSAVDVAAVEAQIGMRLPAEYVAFLTSVGNGGAGPVHGLHSVGHSLDLREPRFLREDFPHQQAWNATPEETQQDYRSWDDYYFLDEHVAGSIPVCHLGEGHQALLVLRGPQRGRIWLDLRSTDDGVRPLLARDGGPIGFLDWYDRWVSEALAAVA